MSEPIDPDVVLGKMLRAYASFKSYRDAGHVAEVDYPGTENESSNKSIFTTSFRRPNLFRFEWCDISDDQVAEEWRAVWSDGKSTYQRYPATGVKEVADIGDAIRSGAGALSSFVALKAPLWLLPEIEDYPSIELINFDYVGGESVQGEDCHHLRKTQVGYESPSETNIWISTSRAVVLKVREAKVIDHIRFDARYQGRLYRPLWRGLPTFN